MSDPQFDAVVRVFQSSGAYGAWLALADGFVAASRDAALLRPIRSFASSFVRESAGRRLAFIAVTIGIASLAHLAIRAALPHYATSGLPWWWNVTVAVFAFAIARSAETLSGAWTNSTPARIWHRLTA